MERQREIVLAPWIVDHGGVIEGDREPPTSSWRSKSSLFWKRYKKTFSNVEDNYIGDLKKGDNLVSKDSDKEELLYNTYFNSEHMKFN